MAGRIIILSMEDRKLKIDHANSIKEALLDFIRIGFSDPNSEVNTYAGYMIKTGKDSFCDMWVENRQLHDGEDEQEIMLFVDWGGDSKIESSTQRIAGRYWYEGVYILKNGDFVKANGQTFKAVKVDNEMHLIEMYR